MDPSLKSASDSRKQVQRKIAVVTGGAQGLGYAICARLLPEWEIALVDIQDCAQQAKQLTIEFGGIVRDFRTDIADRAAVESLARSLREMYPDGIRGLVNCAGIVSRAKPGEGNDEEEVRMFRVNVLGAQHLVDLLTPLMSHAGGGSIVTIASMAGRMGADAAAEAYTGTKADLIGRGKQWAKFYGPRGIRSNVVAPGPIRTEMLKSWSDEQLRGFIEKTPLRRIAEPEDVANAVWFLLGDESRHITGISLDINGGYYIPT